MSDKKLIIVLVAIIVIVIVLIAIVSNSFKNDGSRYESKTPGTVTRTDEEKAEKNYSNLIDQANKIDSKYNSSVLSEYYITLSKEERNYIDNLIDRILSWINNNDLSEFYENHLAEYYRRAKFPTQDELKEFVEKTFPSNDYTINAYEIEGDSLFLPIVSSANSSEELLDIKVVGYSDENYQLYFDNVQDVLRMMNTYTTDKFSIRINYGIEAQNYCSLLLNITNLGNSAETADFTGTYLYEKVGKRIENLQIIGDTKVTVPGKDKVLFELKFQKYNLYPKGLNYNILWGNKSYDYDMLLNFNSLDDND